jgi:hypothetical protein
VTRGFLVAAFGAVLPGTTANASATARFSLTVPNAVTTAGGTRRPAYVSSSTLSASITVNGGTATGVNLSVGSTNCATVTGGRACTIAVPAALGSDTFTMELYDGPLTGGLPTGNVLSAATNFAATVTEGTANITVPLVLGGVPASVDVGTGAPPTAGTAATIPLTITAYDADGNVIIGSAAYGDPSGNTGIHLVINIASSQVTLHDGAQSGTLIDIAGPTDSVTLQLSAPANILGVPFIVTNPASSRIPAHTSQFVRFNGALTATLLATQFSATPDYTYSAPMDASQATGMPNGFVVSVGSQSSGEVLAYFNSATETYEYCTFNANFNLAPAAVDGGIAVAFNGAFNVQTTPEGTAYYSIGTFSGGSCGNGSRLTQNSRFPTALAYDHDNMQLLVAGNDSTLNYEPFSGSAFTSDHLLAALGHVPAFLSVYDSRRAFLDADYAGGFYLQNYPASIVTVASDANPEALTIGTDRRIYTLDSSTKTVYVSNGTSAGVPYTSGSFSSVSAMLAIGPDGLAYTSDGANLIESLSPGGATQSATPSQFPGGYSGYTKAVYDGHNGYVYAYYDDGFNNSTENVYRLSY